MSSSAATACTPVATFPQALDTGGGAGGVAARWAIPVADMVDFASLTEHRRTEITYTLRVLGRLDAEISAGAPVVATCARLAAQHRHALRGLSGTSLYRKLQAVREGGWRALVKHYRSPSSQPDPFIQELRRRAELNHRSMGEAFQQLREAWAAGEDIPGYGTWQEHYHRLHPELPIPRVWPRGFFPSGWSIDNLRRYAPSKGARCLVQRGIGAAKKHFPSVKRDPSQLRPLELITIDDFELDCLCVFPGDANHRPQIGRMAGLLAIDVATRKKLVWGLGQRLEREDLQADGTVKTVRTGIARVDVQLLIHSLFAKYGLPDYQVTLLVENAAAAISPELQLVLETLFEGRVKVERTGLINQKTITNGFVEHGGKPWEKGWVEACFASLWNMLGAIKGYKGANQRLDKPASLDDALRYTKLLLGQGERALNLPPEAIAQLRLPFASPAEAEAAFAWAIATSERRDNHAYIGFDRVTEFVLADGEAPVGFAELALLPPERQLAVRPVERMQTVEERWAAKLAEAHLTALPPAVLNLLLLTPKKVSYRNHAVTFVHERVGYTYLDEAGQILAGRRDGEEFLAYFDPAHPEHLQLADLQGRYLGQLRRLGGHRGAVDIRDRAALADAAALQATVVNRTVAEVQARHAIDRAAAQADRLHNAGIVAEHRAATAALPKAERIARAATEATSAAASASSRADALRSAAAAEELDSSALL